MALNDDIRQLSEITIFRHLENDALRLLAFSSETRLLRSGDILFREGETSDGAFFVTVGAFALQSARDPTAMRVDAPALLGELALLTETTRPATAKALAPATVRKIPRSLFHRVLEESPLSATKIRAMLAARIADYADELDVYARDGGG